MKYFLSLLFIGSLMLACQPKKETGNGHEHHTSASGQPEADTVKKSLPKEEHAMIGEAHITIKYTAPVVRGRVIWGGLVPYDEVWVTGAHRATSFEINKDFKIGTTSIPGGKYAIFTIPGEDKWTFILNKNWDQHLADDYNATDDVARIGVIPEVLTEHQERLNYAIIDLSNNKAELQISWEKIKISIPLQFD